MDDDKDIKIAELEATIADLEKELTASENECGKHEEEIDTLAQKLNDAEKQIDELEDELETPSGYVPLLERIADHGNWTDNAWTPKFKGHHDDHLADEADRVLREGK